MLINVTLLVASILFFWWAVSSLEYPDACPCCERVEEVE